MNLEGTFSKVHEGKKEDEGKQTIVQQSWFWTKGLKGELDQDWSSYTWKSDILLFDIISISFCFFGAPAGVLTPAVGLDAQSQR